MLNRPMFHLYSQEHILFSKSNVVHVVNRLLDFPPLVELYVNSTVQFGFRWVLSGLPIPCFRWVLSGLNFPFHVFCGFYNIPSHLLLFVSFAMSHLLSSLVSMTSHP